MDRLAFMSKSGDFFVIDVRRKKHEVWFMNADFTKLETIDRLTAFWLMTEWVETKLPFYVEIDYDASRKTLKGKLRTWLNLNCHGVWAYHLNGVSFDSDRDASLFRVFHG